VLDFDLEKGLALVHPSAKIENSIIIQPCFIGENVVVKNAVVGPHVSLGKDSVVEDSIVRNTNVQHQTTIRKAVIENAMIGSNALYDGRAKDLSLGDFSSVHE